MGDHDHGHALLRGQLVHVVDNGPGPGFVHGGRGFVGQDQTRLMNQGAQDGHALALAQILRECGVHKMRLMGTPRRMPSMTGYGLEITGYIPKE